MLRPWCILVIGAILGTKVIGDENCGQSNRLIFSSPGNITITGLFDAHEGENCSSPVASGLEHAAAAIWTVGVLNQHNYLPGLQIGISIFDGCSDKDEIKKSFVQSLVLQDCLKPDTVTLGTFTTSEIKNRLNLLASGLNQTISSVSQLLDSSLMLTMAADLLREMSFTTVHRAIAESSDLLNDFGRRMAEEGICVYDQVLISDTNAVNNEVLQPPESTDEKLVTSGPPVIFVLAESSKIRHLLKNLGSEMSKMNEIIWLMAPTDSVFETSNAHLPNRTYILSAIVPKIKDLEMFIHNSDVVSDPLNHRQPSKSPFFLIVASKILNILSPLKEIQNKSCGDVNETCSEVFEFLQNVTTGKFSSGSDYQAPLSAESIEEVLKATKIQTDKEMFLFGVNEKSNADDVALFEIYNEEEHTMSPTLLILKERQKRSIVRVGIEDIKKRDQIPESPTTTTEESQTTEIPIKIVREKHPCHEESGNLSSSCGICLNFVKFLSQVAHQEKQTEIDLIEVGWRFETWVTVNISVSVIGVLCSITIFIFIFTRICMGDILEGSPALSFFLLIAVMITYIATVPFSFYTSGTQGDLTLTAVICDLRVAGPPLSYSILFSILLSRGMMLAASDQDGGFMSHVNGYLQAVIIFFTCAVQFAMSVEYWIFSSFFFNPSNSCQAMYNSHKFILLLSYDLFLLILLMSVVPFMMRSKRNYKEGTFFSVTIIMIFLLWGTWIPLFFLLPPSFNDATVVLGVSGTATAILVGIFIPRTYLMTTAIVRDRIASSLPPLNHTEHQFRSTQALYDTLNLSNKVGNTNPNFYAVNPIDSGPSTPQIRPGEYYSSDAALKIPTPKRNAPNPKLRLRSETPEPNYYQEFDSPVHSPSHVTRF